MTSQYRLLWRLTKMPTSAHLNAVTTGPHGCAIISVTSLQQELSTQSKLSSMSSSSLLTAQLKPFLKIQASSHLSCKPFKELAGMYKFRINGWIQSETMSISWSVMKFRQVLEDQVIHFGLFRSLELCLISSHVVNQSLTVTQWGHVFSNSSLSVSCPVHISILLGVIQLHVW